MEDTFNWLGILVVASGMGVLAVFLIPYMARVEKGRFLLEVLIYGPLFKLGASMLRLWFAFVAYGGIADAASYNSNATLIAQNIWQFQFDRVGMFLQWGTNFVDFVTGLIYALIGPTLQGGYLIYAFLAFLGSYFFYRAFIETFPQGHNKLYAILIFFFPTILYWPNGIGKDALIFLGIGLSAYGSALLMRGRLRGIAILALGLFGTFWVRPHIAAVLGLAFILAVMLGGLGKQSVRPATVILSLLAVGVMVWFLLPRAMSYIGIDELSTEEVLGFLQQQQILTFQGGSAFQVSNALNPLNFPATVVTLLFRPFPWEAHNLQALAQSLEGAMFAGVVLWRLPSLCRAVAGSVSSAYLRFILLFTIAFIIGFSAIQNFGILARERAMMLPLFFMLLAYAPLRGQVKSPVQEAAVR